MTGSSTRLTLQSMSGDCDAVRDAAALACLQDFTLTFTTS